MRWMWFHNIHEIFWRNSFSHDIHSLLQQWQPAAKKRLILKCRIVNDVLQIWERKKNLFRGTPIKRPHREVIVLALANSELLLEIMKGKELV